MSSSIKQVCKLNPCLFWLSSRLPACCIRLLIKPEQEQQRCPLHPSMLDQHFLCKFVQSYGHRIHRELDRNDWGGGRFRVQRASPSGQAHIGCPSLAPFKPLLYVPLVLCARVVWTGTRGPPSLGPSRRLCADLINIWNIDLKCCCVRIQEDELVLQGISQPVILNTTKYSCLSWFINCSWNIRHVCFKFVLFPFPQTFSSVSLQNIKIQLNGQKLLLCCLVLLISELVFACGEVLIVQMQHGETAQGIFCPDSLNNRLVCTDDLTSVELITAAPWKHTNITSMKCRTEG